eukprot:353859-Chlamydomonas_euryale.AAC.1
MLSHQPTKQPTNQPNSQPTNQTANQPTNQPNSQPNSQATSQATSQPSLAYARGGQVAPSPFSLLLPLRTCRVPRAHPPPPKRTRSHTARPLPHTRSLTAPLPPRHAVTYPPPASPPVFTRALSPHPLAPPPPHPATHTLLSLCSNPLPKPPPFNPCSLNTICSPRRSPPLDQPWCILRHRSQDLDRAGLTDNMTAVTFEDWAVSSRVDAFLRSPLEASVTCLTKEGPAGMVDMRLRTYFVLSMLQDRLVRAVFPHFDGAQLAGHGGGGASEGALRVDASDALDFYDFVEAVTRNVPEALDADKVRSRMLCLCVCVRGLEIHVSG